MSLSTSNENEQSNDFQQSNVRFEYDEQTKHEFFTHNNDENIELLKSTTENEQLDLFSDQTKLMDESNRMEKSDVIVVTRAVSLRGLLSYQDVMQAIEREFHLHVGQEREIIMKLWLKGQTMISILQRFRHLLQDLNIDDKDFVIGLKQIREIVNYTERDLQHFREQSVLLENQNRFLENEFQRQLDKIVQEKNEHISRLTHIIDQSCTSTPQQQSSTTISGSDELVKKFMQQNVELQREIGTLRAKLEYTLTLVNEKFDQSNVQTSSVGLLKNAFEQIRDTESRVHELKFKVNSLQEENDLLKYVIEKSSKTPNIQQQQLLRIVEQRSLERELDRIQHELQLTDKRTKELEQRFENADELVKFHLEKFKLECDVLRQHMTICTQRLNDITKQKQSEESFNEKKAHELEQDLFKTRQRFNELIEHANTLKSELTHTRKQLQEKEKRELSCSSELESQRHHTHQLEIELKSLRTKYDDVCERISAATHQLEKVKVVLEETSHRCEQLEKEKLRKKLSEINVQSENLSQNVANVTAKYKDKLNTIKSRLEQTEREKRETQQRCEQYTNEIELLKDELLHKKEMMFEKDKIIQDTQYQNREIQIQKHSYEEKISQECRKSIELGDKNRYLEEELERLRKSSNIERRMETNSLANDSSKQIDELRIKIDDLEKMLNEEKLTKESLQVQIKILEEENIDLREIMNQMRRRAHDKRYNNEHDRNDEIQQLLARVEYNARQYMTNFNLSNLTSSSSALVKIVPLSLSATTKI